MAAAARLCELRESIDRGMLRTRGSLRARLKHLDESARGGKDMSTELDKLGVRLRITEDQPGVAAQLLSLEHFRDEDGL